MNKKGMNGREPLVSIILPVYNGEEFLAKSIESCINQTHKNLELIIVNDASTDSSLQIAKYYADCDSRIKIISNYENKNLPTSLNIGHKFSNGQFLTWTSDDNFYSIGAIDILLQNVIKHKADIAFSNFEIINDKGIRTGIRNIDPNNCILLDNIVGACFLYKRKVFERNNGYAEDLFRIEDYAFWLNASKFASIKHVPQVLYSYRSHANSLTAKKATSQFTFNSDYLQTAKKMYERFFGSFQLERTDDISDLFFKLHLHQEIDICRLLGDFQTYRKILIPVFTTYGEQRILNEIDKRLRYNIQRYSSNQNIRTLVHILRYRPKILFSYSKGRTLRIIYLMTLSKIKF